MQFLPSFDFSFNIVLLNFLPIEKRCPTIPATTFMIKLLLAQLKNLDFGACSQRGFWSRQGELWAGHARSRDVRPTPLPLLAPSAPENCAAMCPTSSRMFLASYHANRSTVALTLASPPPCSATTASSRPFVSMSRSQSSIPGDIPNPSARARCSTGV